MDNYIGNFSSHEWDSHLAQCVMDLTQIFVRSNIWLTYKCQSLLIKDLELFARCESSFASTCQRAASTVPSS